MSDPDDHAVSITLEDKTVLRAGADGIILNGPHAGSRIIGFGPNPDGTLALAFNEVFGRGTSAMLGMVVKVIDAEYRTHLLPTALTYQDRIHSADWSKVTGP